MTTPEDEAATFDVTVWNVEGDIVLRNREATETELSEIEDRYDDPLYLIEVERHD